MQTRYYLSSSFVDFRAKRLIYIILIFLSCTSCKKFLEVDPPRTQVSSETVFSDDVTATSALTGIYVKMFEQSSFSCGGAQSVSVFGGLSSDELAVNSPSNTLALEFEGNNILPVNSDISSFWTSAYAIIYQANDILAGLSNSTGVTVATKKQLEGEALVVRSLCLFNLVNYFGDVPLVVSKDYAINAAIGRTPKEEIYTKIIADLLSAKGLLVESYVSTDYDTYGPARIRPNKFTATALLARVYLYQKKWAEAEEQASEIINANTMYQLESINNVFLKNNTEAIWQLRPATFNGIGTTAEALLFVENYSAYFILRPEFISSFEPGDQRFSEWILPATSGSTILYRAAKYQKVNTSTPASEYSVVFRLGEQFLIRAEARAHQNKLVAAIADVDTIRTRANLPRIHDSNPSISQTDLLLAVESERRHEFFTEWGHRWLDLKRTERAMIALSALKAGITETDLLYPIPQSEFDKNPKLGNQNPGY